MSKHNIIPEAARKVFGGYLKCGREKMGMSLRKAEAATGISHVYLWQVEKGEHELSFARACKLCDVYGLSIQMMKHLIEVKP